MANTFSRFINRILPGRRCPACKRLLYQAISEQVTKQEGCPLENCRFKKEINDAILLSKTPELKEFTSDKNEIITSESITIKWELLNVKQCSIKGIGSVKEKDSIQIFLKKSSAIVLEFEAYNGDVYESEPIWVKVYPSPEITEFSVTRKEIIKGNTTTFSWKSKNCLESYILINGVKTFINPNGAIELTPVVDTEIGLYVIGPLNKEIHKHDIIKVYEPAQILSFVADKTEVLETDIITFYYKTRNALKVYLSGSSIQEKMDITENNEIKFCPQLNNNHSLTQTFYLEVFDKLNNPITKHSIDVAVYPPPIIISFILSKVKILIGEEIQISWDVKNFTQIHLQIEDQIIDVSTLLHYRIKPKKTSNCKLIITSLANLKTIESQIQIIHVFDYVELNFNVNKNYTIQSIPVTLYWNVKNASEVLIQSRINTLSSIYDSVLNVTGLKELQVCPDKTTFYKMIAKNDLNQAEMDILVNVYKLPKITSISLPVLPSFKQSQPISLDFNERLIFYKTNKCFKDTRWYYDLFTWQPKDIGKWFINLFNQFNKRLFTIIK